MMNQIIINGVLKDIEESHSIGNVQFNKANVLCLNSNGKESLLNIKYKKYSNSVYNEGDVVNFVGNLRSFSEKRNDKNHVNIYVYTYFDAPEEILESGNVVDIDGRICSIEPLRELKNGKQNIHLILANNILTNDTKINSYIPCIAWGKLAVRLSELSVNQKIHVTKGELRSREYIKHLESGEDEFRMCHELYIQEYELVDSEEI